MKILFVLNNFLPQHVAGTEVYGYHLGKELQKMRHEVGFIIPNYGKEQTDSYVYDGMKVIQYAEPSVVDRALKMGKRKSDGLKNFEEVLKNEQPDIVHFHEIAGSNGISLLHVSIARGLGFKVVMTFHLGRYTASFDNVYMPTDLFDIRTASYNFYCNKGFGNRLARMFCTITYPSQKLKLDLSDFGKIGLAFSVRELMRRKLAGFYELVDNCDKVVAIAKWYYEALIANGISDKKLRFIEQGIDADICINDKMPLSYKKLRIVFIGRISHFKGVKMLIEAIREIASEMIILDIYGESGENQNYINECRSLASSIDNVQLMGRVRPENVISIMSAYDLLVLPSTFSEMSPLVIREAFAAGIPVLASDSMGAKEQIQDGVNGWLFRMNDNEDLKAKLKMLVENPELIEKAKQHLPPVRSFEEVGKDYLTLYKSLLSD